VDCSGGQAKSLLECTQASTLRLLYEETAATITLYAVVLQKPYNLKDKEKIRWHTVANLQNLESTILPPSVYLSSSGTTMKQLNRV
jgi:hypothetical protein